MEVEPVSPPSKMDVDSSMKRPRSPDTKDGLLGEKRPKTDDLQSGVTDQSHPTSSSFFLQPALVRSDSRVAAAGASSSSSAPDGPAVSFGFFSDEERLRRDLAADVVRVLGSQRTDVSAEIFATLLLCCTENDVDEAAARGRLAERSCLYQAADPDRQLALDFACGILFGSEGGEAMRVDNARDVFLEGEPFGGTLSKNGGGSSGLRQEMTDAYLTWLDSGVDSLKLQRGGLRVEWAWLLATLKLFDSSLPVQLAGGATAYRYLLTQRGATGLVALLRWTFCRGAEERLGRGWNFAELAALAFAIDSRHYLLVEAVVDCLFRLKPISTFPAGLLMTATGADVRAPRGELVVDWGGNMLAHWERGPVSERFQTSVTVSCHHVGCTEVSCRMHNHFGHT